MRRCCVRCRIRDPDRLVTIWETEHDAAQGYASPLNMLDWNARSRTFEQIAGFTPSVGGMVMAGADGNAETVSRQWVTAGIFDVLGVKPIAGRTFRPPTTSQRANVRRAERGVLANAIRRRPGVSAARSGSTACCGRWSASCPKEFQLLGQTSIWAMQPVARPPAARARRYMLQAVGRLKPGVSLEAAQADLAAVADGLAREFPQTNKGRGVTLEPTARRDDRQRARADLDAVSRRRRLRAADLLRERRQPAAGARDRPHARAGGPLGARRRPAAHHPPAADREPRAVARSAARSGLRHRRRDPERGAVADSGGTAAGGRDARRSTCASSRSAPPRRCSSACCSAWRRRGRRPSSRRRRRSASDSRTTTGRGGRCAACSSSARSRPRCCCCSAPACCCARYGGGRRRPRLSRRERADDAGRSAGVEVPDAGDRCSSSSTRSSAKSEPCPACGASRGRARCRSASSTDGASRSRSSAIRRSDASQRPTADYQIVSPTYFSTLDLPIVAGRGFDDRDTRDSVPVCIVNEAFVRSIFRADRRSACGSPSAGRLAGGAAESWRDRRRRAAGEGPARRNRGLRAGLCADGAGLRRRHLSARAAEVRTRGGACAVGPRGDWSRSTRSSW